jgi:hypothetical protein
MIPFQKAVTYVLMVIPVLFCELFWNPLCTNFVEVKSVLDNFISRTVTDLQFATSPIITILMSRISVLSSSVFLSVVNGVCYRGHSLLVAFVQPFFNVTIVIHASLHQKAVVIRC